MIDVRTTKVDAISWDNAATKGNKSAADGIFGAIFDQARQAEQQHSSRSSRNASTQDENVTALEDYRSSRSGQRDQISRATEDKEDDQSQPVGPCESESEVESTQPEPATDGADDTTGTDDAMPDDQQPTNEEGTDDTGEQEAVAATVNAQVAAEVVTQTQTTVAPPAEATTTVSTETAPAVQTTTAEAPAPTPTPTTILPTTQAASEQLPAEAAPAPTPTTANTETAGLDVKPAAEAQNTQISTNQTKPVAQPTIETNAVAAATEERPVAPTETPVQTRPTVNTQQVVAPSSNEANTQPQQDAQPQVNTLLADDAATAAETKVDTPTTEQAAEPTVTVNTPSRFEETKDTNATTKPVETQDTDVVESNPSRQEFSSQTSQEQTSGQSSQDHLADLGQMRVTTTRNTDTPTREFALPNTQPDIAGRMPENIDRAVKSVRLAVEQGETRVQMRLDPPELGQLRVEIRQDSDGLKLQLHASNAKAQQVLQQSSSELKAALEAQGFQGHQIDIEVRVDTRNQANAGQQDDSTPQDQPEGQPEQQSSFQEQHDSYEQGQHDQPTRWEEPSLDDEQDMALQHAGATETAAVGNDAAEFSEWSFSNLDLTA